VFASLPTPEVVDAVAAEVTSGNRIKTFVDLSTTGPKVAARIGERLAGSDITAIDCPVSGGVPGAAKGVLALMASGPRAEIATIEPVLKVFGKVFFLGERPGLGQTMKLVNNVLSATAMAATSEALVAGMKAGLDPRLMLDVINAGTGRNTMTEDKVAKAILPGTFNLGFTAGLLLKDVNLFLAEGEALGVPTDVITAVARLLRLTCDEIGPQADVSAIIKPIEKRAGVEVRARSA